MEYNQSFNLSPNLPATIVISIIQLDLFELTLAAMELPGKVSWQVKKKLGNIIDTCPPIRNTTQKYLCLFGGLFMGSKMIESWIKITMKSYYKSD